MVKVIHRLEKKFEEGIDRSVKVAVEAERGKLLYFFLALLLFLLVYPYFAFAGMMWVLFLLISLKIIFGAYAFVKDKKHFYVILCFAVPYLILNWLVFFKSSNFIMNLSLITSVLFYGTAATILMIHVFRAKVVTKQEIFAVLSIYLVLGFGWASAYTLVENVNPGSFSGLTADQQGKPLDFVYYSFTTLTTMGYGDIVPITNRARSLSILEGTIGILFVAVMIARLVGMYHRKLD